MGGIEDIQVEYDRIGRIKYNPELHYNHGEGWTEEDLEYLCKYESVDSMETLALALGRTYATVAERLKILKQKGEFEHYKNLNKYW